MITLKKIIAGKVGSKRRLQEADANNNSKEDFDLPDESPFDDKIDRSVTTATKDVADLTKIFTAFKSKVENLSIASMLSNPSEAESLYEKVKTAKNYAKQKYEYYFDIVEPYDFMDMPKNVKQLDKLVQKLNYLQDNLGYIMYAMDGLVEAAKDFNRFNQIEDEE